jgi:hypothetical protein
MAVWFVTVIASFLFIRIVTGADYISNSVLALIGIGSGTALGAAVIGVGSSGSQETEGVLKDILSSDGTNITFHRFQMVVWTLVLWSLFVVAVWTRLSMPEFSATLLALQGISAGTYLGFKIDEKKPGNPVITDVFPGAGTQNQDIQLLVFGSDFQSPKVRLLIGNDEMVGTVSKATSARIECAVKLDKGPGACSVSVENQDGKQARLDGRFTINP